MSGPQPQPLEFVYAGLRPGASSTLVMAVYPIDPQGALLRERCFKADRRARVLGGVYSGALFTDEQVVGLYGASYTGKQWGREHADQVMTWEALDRTTRFQQRAKALEDDAKKQTLIEETMAPLRDLYWAAVNRGDIETTMALERAVVAALKRRPSK